MKRKQQQRRRRQPVERKFERKSAPMSRSAKARTRTMRTTPLSGGGIRVQHSELFATVSSTGVGFNGYRQIIEPGNLTWLKGIAGNYEFYTVRSMRVRFVSALAATSAGSFYMAAEFDDRDDGVEDAKELMASRNATTCRAWESTSMVLPPKLIHAMHPRKKVTVDGRRLTERNMYFTAILQTYTSGVAAGTAGNIYLDYDIEFYGATGPQNVKVTTTHTGLRFNSNPLNMATGAIQYLDILNDSAPAMEDGMDLVADVAAGAPDELKLTPGNYRIHFRPTYNKTAACPDLATYSFIEMDGSVVGQAVHNAASAVIEDVTHGIETIIHVPVDAVIKLGVRAVFGAGAVVLTDAMAVISSIL